MSRVAGGFIVPHVPNLLADPSPAPGSALADVMTAYAEAGARLAALEPTTVVVIGADHYILFGPGCLPQMVIGTGELDGPIERLPGLQRGRLLANEPLAEHIRRHTGQAGFDWAVARALTVDHSIALPYQLLVRPYGEIPLIPVYLAAGVEPYIPLPRAAALGAAISRAVAEHDGDERVVVIGSGGISHSVGTARMGEVNEDFDREVLDLVRAGDIDSLARFSDERILAEGGNGALELRNLVCAQAAVGGAGEVIAYVPAPELLTGMGFAELFPPEGASA
jgi:protocatechuate 4,5-dioxygenase, beta chain